MRDIEEMVRRISERYVWWQEPENAPQDLHRLIAQVMELGTHEDAEALRRHVGDDVLRQILRTAQPGWFSGKSWHYWHYAVGIAAFGEVPEQPRRRYA